MLDARGPIDELVAPYVLGALEPDEVEVVDNHLVTCDACQRLVDEERETVRLLPYLPAPVPVPLRARRGLLARIEASQEADEALPVSIGAGTGSGSGMRTRRVPVAVARLGWLTAVSAAVLAIAFGWNSYRMQDQVDKKNSEISTLQQNQTSIVEFMATRNGVVTTLQSTGAAPGAAGSVILNPTTNAAMLFVEGLPRPPVGHAYVVWMTRGAEHRNAGILPIDNTGRATLYITMPEALTTFDSIVVTEESGPLATNPSGVRMMAARVAD
jgi:hypothetical protein